MAKKETRGMRGEGYFLKKDNINLYRIPIGLYENGRTKYMSFSGKTKREAYTRAMDYKAIHIDKRPLGDNPILSDYLKQWLRVYKKDAKAVKSQTYTRMCGVVNRQIIPKIGDYRVCDLTKNIIQSELINPLLNEINTYTNRPLSISSVSKALIHLKDCLNQAVNDEIILRNPCAGIKLNVNAPGNQTKEIRFLTDEEIESFTEAARATTVNGFPVYKYSEILIFDIFTGLRAGEFLVLQKKDVDLNKRRVRVHGGLINYYDLDEESPTYRTSVNFHAEGTKTSSGARYVPLCDEALAIATSLCSRCKSDDDYIVTGTASTILYSNVLRTFKQICARAGISTPNGVHTLRHTCASLLIRNKTDIKIVSEMLGHSSVNFTYDIYVHLIKEQTDEAVRKIGRSMAGKERLNQKSMIEVAVEEGLTPKTISQLLMAIPADVLGVLLSEICN